MSATTLAQREIGPDGIARYRTQYKVLVNSHNTNGVIDLGNSVIKVSSNKNIKSVGNLSLSLISDRNLLNLVYPNDHINVYVDRADGQGWTRLFYGFIDQIDESYSAGSPPSTIYSLQCSDFSKSADRTQIYFNPHVASRADFSGGFIGTPNLGGMALMTRGIIMNGSPPDMVTNVMLMLMGFGSQFILPASYNPRLMGLIRQQRADFILNRLSADARRQVFEAGSYADFLERIRRQTGASSPVSELTDPDAVTADKAQALERARFSAEAIAQLGGTGSGVGTQGTRLGTERGIEAYNALNTTLAGYPPTLLDVMDIFTYVEREAMDGYYTGASMWERQGNVTSFLRYITNEIVNELFFDLRPVSRGGGLVAGSDYSRDLDEIAGNAGSDDVPNGIQYVPALVMREYPFSTINAIDGTNIPLSVRGSSANSKNPTATPAAQSNLGRIHFGAIFSDQPGVPGRHIVHIPNINPGDLAEGLAGTRGTKHLDVAVVRDHEILSTKFSRNDSDHHNLLEIISDAMVGQAGRFYMQDLLPIITPVHIVRHGLRVRSLQTRAARFPPTVTNRLQPQPTREDTPQAEPAAATPGTSRLPIDFIPGEQGFISSRYGYRNRPYPTPPGAGPHPARPFNQQRVMPPGESIWRFHNGVDFAAGVGTPVYAVRDGWVVCASPARNVVTTGRDRGKGQPTPGFDGYGGTVIIYHDQDSPQSEDGTTAPGAVFTLYAHLYNIEAKFLQGRSTLAKSRMAPELRADGTYRKVRVRAGEKIGEVGRTGFMDRNMGAHLHFEVMVKRGSRVYPSMNQRLTPDILQRPSQLNSNGGWAPATTSAGGTTQVSATKPGLPAADQSISQDPVAYLTRWIGTAPPIGSDATDPNTSSGVPPDSGDETDTSYDGDADELVDTAETPPSPTEDNTTQETQSATQAGYVDTPDVRRQVARWALLNDHWYQHNLEYISGTIEMRGAPEIRVGYRVDLEDRNLSFYVENVSHNWSYGKPMTTTLHVTRGQPNNPYPGYVMPFINGFDPTETQRQTSSRLAQYFIIPDPVAVRRGLKLEANRGSRNISMLPQAARASATLNETDMPNEGGTLLEKYNEQILPAESISVHVVALSDQQQGALGLRGADANLSAVQTNPQGGIPDELIADFVPLPEGLA